MNSPHSHEHVFLGAAHEENAKRTLWVVILTVVMMVAEIAAGAFTGSMALLADGFHMATHAAALGIAAAAYAYAKRNANSPRYSFGTGKVGDLGGFASALILALVSLGIGVESVIRLLQPAEVQFGTARNSEQRSEECRSQELFHETDSADFHFQLTLSGTGLVLSIFEYTGISRKNAK